MQHLQPNTTLQGGKYRIERVLGQGGFGNTYIATNTVFDDHVAIKEFYLSGINDREGNSTAVSVTNGENLELFEEQKEKFKKEARRMRHFNNPHIVRVHDLFEENGTAYYVMDYIDGENLSERLNRTDRPMTESEVCLILPQILDALKAVHDAGIWHLDLKPSNIMLEKGGIIKLIDFGASKQLDSKKGGATTGTRINYTPGFAPREQMEQNYDKFGPWTDLYALGATLYNLLTNKRPPLPSDIDDDDTEDKHIALPTPHPVSIEMRNLIIWMMMTNYKERPKSVISVRKLIEKGNTSFSATNDKRVQVSPQIVKTAIVEPSIPKATADSQTTRRAPEIHKEKKAAPLYGKTTNNHQTNLGCKPNVALIDKSGNETTSTSGFQSNGFSTPPPIHRNSTPPYNNGGSSSSSFWGAIGILIGIIMLFGIGAGVFYLIQSSNGSSIEQSKTEILSGSYDLHGHIDSYPITMHFVITNNNVSGYHYYDRFRTSSADEFKLSGTKNGQHLELVETAPNGNITGHFNGTFENGIFTGEFVNYQGKKMQFYISKKGNY